MYVSVEESWLRKWNERSPLCEREERKGKLPRHLLGRDWTEGTRLNFPPFASRLAEAAWTLTEKMSYGRYLEDWFGVRLRLDQPRRWRGGKWRPGWDWSRLDYAGISDLNFVFSSAKCSSCAMCLPDRAGEVNNRHRLLKRYYEFILTYINWQYRYKNSIILLSLNSI